MNHKRNVLIIVLAAALFTAFAYLIDSDPPYPNVWHSVIEFCAWTFFLSGFIGIFYAGAMLIHRLEKRQKAKN